ncbi:MAG: hypothetical protein LBT65_05315, partial [Synergistaceae bacterium]|nr:hypothetical protein [Synergistaceae bacterium]
MKFISSCCTAFTFISKLHPLSQIFPAEETKELLLNKVDNYSNKRYPAFYEKYRHTGNTKPNWNGFTGPERISTQTIFVSGSQNDKN